jgi:hypothetical protein
VCRCVLLRHCVLLNHFRVQRQVRRRHIACCCHSVFRGAGTWRIQGAGTSGTLSIHGAGTLRVAATSCRGADTWRIQGAGTLRVAATSCRVAGTWRIQGAGTLRVAATSCSEAHRHITRCVWLNHLRVQRRRYIACTRRRYIACCCHFVFRGALSSSSSPFALHLHCEWLDHLRVQRRSTPPSSSLQVYCVLLKFFVQRRNISATIHTACALRVAESLSFSRGLAEDVEIAT